MAKRHRKIPTKRDNIRGGFEGKVVEFLLDYSHSNDMLVYITAKVNVKLLVIQGCCKVEFPLFKRPE
jgi:hypothetical protein